MGTIILQEDNVCEKKVSTIRIVMENSLPAKDALLAAHTDILQLNQRDCLKRITSHHMTNSFRGLPVMIRN